jgi:hypothetical protein
MWKLCGGLMWIPCLFILFVLRFLNCDGGPCYVDGKIALLFLVPIYIRCFRCFECLRYFHPMVVLLLVVFLAFVVAVSHHPPSGSIGEQMLFRPKWGFLLPWSGGGEDNPAVLWDFWPIVMVVLAALDLFSCYRRVGPSFSVVSLNLARAAHDDPRQDRSRE